MSGQDTLKRGSGRIIAFDEFFVHVFFRYQFEDGLEEVGIEAQVGIDALEKQEFFFGLEAVIANEAADNRPVLLLDMGLVVFMVRARASKGDLFGKAVVVEQVVDKFAAIV